MTPIAIFDYETLSPSEREAVSVHTEEIKHRLKRTAEDIIEIGDRLIKVKALLPHGAFGTWLSAEFDWSYPTANRFMNVARAFDEISHGDRFEAKALYLLASPSTPEEAREEAIERAEAGEVVSYEVAKVIVDEHEKAERDREINELLAELQSTNREIDIEASNQESEALLSELEAAINSQSAFLDKYIEQPEPIASDSPTPVDTSSLLGDYIKRPFMFRRADYDRLMETLNHVKRTQELPTHAAALMYIVDEWRLQHEEL